MMSADGGQHYKYRAYRRLPQVYEYKASRSRMDAGHTSSGAISHNLVGAISLLRHQYPRREWPQTTSPDLSHGLGR